MKITCIIDALLTDFIGQSGLEGEHLLTNEVSLNRFSDIVVDFDFIVG
jgi:hypothetical protein